MKIRERIRIVICHPMFHLIVVTFSNIMSTRNSSKMSLKRVSTSENSKITDKLNRYTKQRQKNEPKMIKMGKFVSVDLKFLINQ